MIQFEYVDLGLPSGLKWAKCNVGATSETDYGDYFMWGSTEPNTADECNWATYKHCNGTYNTLTKYNNLISIGYDYTLNSLIYNHFLFNVQRKEISRYG